MTNITLIVQNRYFPTFVGTRQFSKIPVVPLTGIPHSTSRRSSSFFVEYPSLVRISTRVFNYRHRYCSFSQSAEKVPATAIVVTPYASWVVALS